MRSFPVVVAMINLIKVSNDPKLPEILITVTKIWTTEARYPFGPVT
jgi:hypothetical protein